MYKTLNKKSLTYKSHIGTLHTKIQNIGDKVTLDATGTKVTATTVSGVFEITQIDGTEVGNTVLGMFRR